MTKVQKPKYLKNPVYLVIECVAYEGSDIIKAYRDKAKADVFAAEYAAARGWPVYTESDAYRDHIRVDELKILK